MPRSSAATPRVLLLSVLSLFLAACQQQAYDPTFDARVATPTHTSANPRVLFDEAHHNRHTATTGYKPLATLLENDGYSVVRGREPFSPEFLSRHDILIIAGAMGLNDEGDDPAFTPDEVRTVEAWVRSGGSLLLAVDHYPFGDAAGALAQAFGVSLGRGFTEDAVHYDRASSDKSQLVFSQENGLLADHPIIQGRNATERINRVVTFTGTSLRGPATAAVLRLSSAAVDYDPDVTVERSGSDSRVRVNYVNPHPTTGNAQALALEVGEGRLVIMGEAAALTAQRSRHDGAPLGMNLEGFDNRQFALNVMRWLSRVL